jgi:hypothetical protein
MLLHSGWTFAGIRVTVAAQIGQYYLVTGNESVGRGQPQFMVGGEGMEQHDWWPRAEDLVCNRGVATLDLNHRGELNTRVS